MTEKECKFKVLSVVLDLFFFFFKPRRGHVLRLLFFLLGASVTSAAEAFRTNNHIAFVKLQCYRYLEKR